MTTEIIKYYAKDNVFYLELTVDPLSSCYGESHETFLRNIFQCIACEHKDGYPMIIQLLMIIDLKKPLNKINELLQLAFDCGKKLIEIFV